uniref:Uncharacterized protein n=1 Tax=Anopheles quadriannulatus TaxID=34691 RepID=A0A182XTL6_ANOQN
TGTRQIHTATRLATASVRVEISLTKRQIETQQSSVRVDNLDVVSVSRCNTISRIVDGEQRQGRIQGNNRVQTSTRHTLANNTGRVSSQAVPSDVHVVERHTSALVQEIDETGDSSSHSIDVIAGRDVVRVLRTATPVNDDHVDVGTVQVSVADSHVHFRSSVVVPAVDNETRLTTTVPVRSKRASISGSDTMSTVAVVTREQQENGIGISVEQRSRLILAAQVEGIGVHQMQTTITIGDKLPVRLVTLFFVGSHPLHKAQEYAPGHPHRTVQE